MGNFVAIDFETSYGHIPCSIGIIEFQNGEPIREYYSLIKPIDLKFNPINSRINGIFLEDVYNEREFDEIWLEIEDFFIDKIIIAHNASTDISILEKTLSYYKIHKPQYEYYCTLNIARDFLKLTNYKLSTLAKHFFIEQNNYHNALEDAFVCGKLFSLFINEFDLKLNKSSLINDKKKNLVSEKIKANTKNSTFISNKLESKIFVVSGVFELYSRDELKKAIEDHGGKVGSSISSKTNYVIAGDNMGPAKLEKANKLGVTIINEIEFNKLING